MKFIVSDESMYLLHLLQDDLEFMRERLQLDDNITVNMALEHFRFGFFIYVCSIVYLVYFFQKRFQHKSAGVIQSDCKLVGSYNEAALSEK